MRGWYYATDIREPGRGAGKHQTSSRRPCRERHGCQVRVSTTSNPGDGEQVRRKLGSNQDGEFPLLGMKKTD